MREIGISIWFFIGLSLLVNGALIVSAGVWQIFNPPINPVVLFRLHANVWWGAMLLVFGVIYCIRFAPTRRGRSTVGS
jgi:hypothetical protein